MFAIGIRYLNGFSVACEPDSREQPEWPPHPARVFMALAAAHFETGEDPAEREALLWLEDPARHHGHPAIRAGEARPVEGVEQFVPVNDDPIWKQGKRKNNKPPPPLQSAPGIMRKRQPRTFARARLDDDTVYLTWQEADPPEDIRRALEALCAKVTRVGHSSSLVQLWTARAEEAGEPDWVPDASRPARHLRVPVPGTLAELERCYRSGGPAGKRGTSSRLRPGIRSYHGYSRRIAVAEAPIVTGTVFSPHLLVHALERRDGPYCALEAIRVLAVAQGWRDALLSRSEGLSDSARRILSGHDREGKPAPGPHMAILPLVFVGRPHADGRLLGLAVALPNGLGTEDRKDVLRAVGRVEEIRLGRLGVWHLERDLGMHPPWNLRSHVWTAYPEGSSEWATVTPIAFDRHPKAKSLGDYHREAAAMIGDACEAIGLPRPSKVVVTGVSPHAGVPPAYRFPRLMRKDGSERRHAHAILVFDRPVFGPILLGAGRYRGYGFCRPMSSHG